MQQDSIEESGAPSQFNFATDVFGRWAGQRPDGLALWCVDAAGGTERRHTFRELSRASMRAAGLLQRCGVQRGDRVLVMLPRVSAWWVAMLGLIRIGAVPVPATLLLTGRDVTYRLATAGVRAVITNAEGMAKVGDYEGIRLLVGGGEAG